MRERERERRRGQIRLTVAKIDGAVALKTKETVTPDGFVSGPGNGQEEHRVELKLIAQLDIVADHAVPKP